MTAKPVVRRPLVILGVVLTLFAAAATVRAAADWAAASAPLANPPASIGSMQAALEQERARSTALQGQLDSLKASSADLAAALSAATDRLATDATTADGLRQSLTDAQTKLAKLEAALGSSHTVTTRTTSGTTAPAPVGDDSGFGGVDD
jgi:septal ring factor EnvC (AmiA/AmiB activator)